MRYLKKFNEEESFESDLMEFCDNYLSYLKDKGFDIKIEYLRYKSIEKHFKISITKPIKTGTGFGSFNYSEIEDDFVQFLKMLDKSYTIDNREFEYHREVSRYKVKIDEIEKIIRIDGDIFEASVVVQTMSHRK